VPPLDNLRAFPRMGFHLTVFSGGKGLRGPQCSGLLLGKKDLIEAAFLNGPPHSDSLGRGTKVGKEEIVGLYRALQLFLAADQEAMGKEWERRVAVIERAVGGVPGLQTERFVPEIANHVPHLRLRWDPGRLPITPRQVIEELRNGDPRIELRPDMEEQRDFIDVGVWMMRAGEERWVGSRLREVFGRGAANDRE
jgi:L-seryl-tRNA(Ser) seleniumtransferase